MTKHYNKTELKVRRRELRKNQTLAEKIMWTHLRNRQLLGFKFRRQYSVDNFVIDFYCPKLKLAIELDGNIHDLPEQKEYDKKRQMHIETYGISFIRISNEEYLGNPNKAFDRIEREIKNITNKIE